ncbi:MAG: cyanophycinase [Betaproteobacteria bacterium]|jgi:cyanophycinase
MNASDPPKASSPRPGRRQLLQGLGSAALWGWSGFAGLGALGGCALAPQPAPPLRVARQLPEGAPVGRLLVIGGGEDRVDDREILRRFMELCGGAQARLRFITGATNDPKGAEQAYGAAMGGLGAQNVHFLHLAEAQDAAQPALLQELRQADGVFITGGDQARLMGKLWSTPAMQALHQAVRERGICLAGTSAGAAAMSRAMIAHGPAVVVPQKEVVSLDLGLNFLPQAMVDQHFSQRRRLSRLLSALALRPDLLGIGVDEDTALLIEIGRSVEVIGRSSVTLVDGSEMQSNAGQVQPRDRLELVGVNLHVLPTGQRYRHPWALSGNPAAGAEPPAALRSVVARLLEPPPILLV